MSEHAGPPDHDARWPDEVAAYVLGALDEHALEVFEAHLSNCPLCRDDVASLRVVADALPVSVTPVAPPPELKDRIMATVRSEAALLASASSASPARRRLRLPSLALRPVIALSGAGALAAGLLIGGLAFSGQGGPGAQLRVASVDTSVESGAVVHVERTGANVSLVVDDLRPPAPGHVYELWIKRAGQAPEPNALFSLSSGSVAVRGDLHDVSQLMVTEEPAGGSRAPTVPPVIVGSLA